MGIESDQLVYDYLSRVGDLAQQRQLTSGDRMRLVADLRLRIDRDRAGATADTPAAVRRILARLGTPEDVVDAAGGPPGPTTPSPPPAPRPSTPQAAVPTQRDPRPRRKPAPNPPRQTPEAEARDTDGAAAESGGTGGAGSGSLRGDGDRTAGGSSGRTAGGGSSTAGGGASKNLGGGESRTAGGGGRRGLDGGGSRAAGGGGRRGDGDGGRNAGAGGHGGLDGDGGRNPGEGEGGGGEAVKGLRRLVPRPRRAPKSPPPEGLAGLEGMEGHRPSPPHLAGSHELGPSGSEPDWWRLDSSPFGLADSVPGFVGGVEIPEILKPPPAPDDPVRPAKDGSAKGDAVDGPLDADEFGEADEAEGRRWWRPRLGGGEGVRFANPLLLCAAALLLVGAVLGSLPALGGGWLIAYLSRRLTRAEAKWAVFGMPGLAVAAGLAWLWGRTDGRWGEPVREGHMSDAIAGTWPWVVRGAAVASALFLVWRSQRRRL